jgi:signal transduction histidine kinase
MSIRLRLTLVYGGLFLLAGVALLVLTFSLVRDHFAVPVKITTVVNGQPVDVVGQATPFGGQFSFTAPSDQAAAGDNPSGRPPGMPTKAEVRAAMEQARGDAYRLLLINSGVALAGMAIVSVALGWAVAGRVLRPLHQITATAKRLSERNLHERIGLRGPADELKELGDTFDAMLGRLDAAFDTQRRFVANASHELRTPLAITRAEVDVTLADPDASNEELRLMGERVREATDRSERLIEGLLTLARSERRLSKHEPVDLGEAAAEALAQNQAAIEALGLRVSQVLGAAPTHGDYALLERMVANLVENAVRHNHKGGHIEVDSGRVGAGTRMAGRAWVQVRVANSGAVLTEKQTAALWEPFRRLTERTGSDRGSGLGLSIVRAVATAHGGDAEARPLPLGGLEVTVTLPAEPPTMVTATSDAEHQPHTVRSASVGDKRAARTAG